MCPPGLTFLSLSQRAMEAAQGNTSRRHYWDLCKAVDFLNKQPPQHPFTPAVNIVMASLAAVTLIQEEGLENVWLRHKRMGKMAREGLRAMGLEPFADERYVSDTLTAVKVPEGIDAQEIIRRMEEDFGIIIAGGNRSLKGKIIRIAHMGYISEGDVLDTLKALEGTLAGLGLPVDEGKAYTAARTIMDIRG